MLSDHLALLTAYQGWRSRDPGPPRPLTNVTNNTSTSTKNTTDSRFLYCQQRRLSPSALSDIHRLRGQFRRVLEDGGFVAAMVRDARDDGAGDGSEDEQERDGGGEGGRRVERGGGAMNAAARAALPAAHIASLVSLCLAFGFCPNLAQLSRTAYKVYIYIYTYVYMCMFICLYVYMFICTYVYMYTSICIYTLSSILSSILSYIL